MRSALEDVFESAGPPDHVGLAYDAWAPVGSDGKIPDDRRADWLAKLATLPVSSDYAVSFNRWRASFQAPGARTFELTLASRLLVGHGNSSATGVGLTVHHTWGVPVIPGSALKGVVAHYVDAIYGPDDPDTGPWEEPDEEQRKRALYQGVTWRGKRMERGPGAVYRSLFGAPVADLDKLMAEHGLEAGAVAGLVTFHDALYVPGSATDNKPYAVDVLTVHQKTYYDSQGVGHWPNDYDRPNPVAFLTVRPGIRMAFALSGPPDWRDLAERLLRAALEEWGIGGKTSAGYGRLVPPERTSDMGFPKGRGSIRPEAALRAGALVEAVLLEERTKKGGWKARHEPSGLSGPIINSGDVPATAKPGDRLGLVVASVTAREIAFRFPPRTHAVHARKKERK